MEERRYLISMNTPLGRKHGKITVMFNGNKINGEMELLQQLTPFEGGIKENGECEINGKLKSLMKTIQYTAQGRITPAELNLNLVSGQKMYMISGEPMMMRNEC